MSNIKTNAVLLSLSNGLSPLSVGRSKFRVGHRVLHVRFCSTDATGSARFKFNINPNTLSADYELWVCGTADRYYLMPVALMRAIYENPNTYVDKAHPEIRVVSVDSRTHRVIYASGGMSQSLREYLNAKFTWPSPDA